MSWDYFYSTFLEWKPIWDYTAIDYLISLSSVILYFTVRYYRSKAIKSQFTREMRELKERSTIFSEELEPFLDNTKDEHAYEDFKTRFDKRIKELESKRS